MKSFELIDAAATLIETSGWAQKHNAQDARGCMTAIHPRPGESQPVAFCVYGALCKVAQKAPPETGDCFTLDSGGGRAFDALSLASPTGSIIRFNDTPGRTKEEVIALMRDTASKLRTAEVVADDKLHAALFN